MKKGETYKKIKEAYERTRKTYMQKYAGRKIYTGSGKKYKRGGIDVTARTLPTVKPITGQSIQKRAEEMKEQTTLMRHYMKQARRYETHLRPLILERNAWKNFTDRVKKDISDSIDQFKRDHGSNPRFDSYIARIDTQWAQIKEAIVRVSDTGAINGGKLIQEDAKNADDLESLFNSAAFEYDPERYSDKYGRITQFLNKLEKVAPSLAHLLKDFYTMQANWEAIEWSEENV